MAWMFIALQFNIFTVIECMATLDFYGVTNIFGDRSAGSRALTKQIFEDFYKTYHWHFIIQS